MIDPPYTHARHTNEISLHCATNDMLPLTENQGEWIVASQKLRCRPLSETCTSPEHGSATNFLSQADHNMSREIECTCSTSSVHRRVSRRKTSLLPSNLEKKVELMIKMSRLSTAQPLSRAAGSRLDVFPHVLHRPSVLMLSIHNVVDSEHDYYGRVDDLSSASA